ncbi:hypothetical protein LCGC14_0458370 [marine sediment metagenome]|uniref:Uncharacterized protein n=1 Tax=marine sediment metagenome TaxID=412755 RepID=A0A0F9VPG8_9ZZZZ
MSNLPDWPGASEVYSKAYKVLEKRVFDRYDRDELIEALNKGDEEKIKGLMLLFREYYPKCFED